MGPSNRSYQAVILRVVRAGEGIEEADPAVVAEHEEGAEEQEDDVQEAGAGRSRFEAQPPWGAPLASWITLLVPVSPLMADVMNGAAPATVKTKRIELLWIASQVDPVASQGVGSPLRQTTAGWQ